MNIADLAFEGNLEQIACLVVAGADVNELNERGHSAIHNAIAAGYIEVIRFLVQEGADINAEDSRGMTPLTYAVAVECDAGSQLDLDIAPTELTKTLIDLGADVNRRSTIGVTPMDIARKYSNVEAARLLKKSGA